jgi:hypothetical protein
MSKFSTYRHTPFCRPNYPTLSGCAALVEEAISVLGGAVKGNCSFEVTIGEECEIVGGSAVEGMQVIAEVTPNDGERKVDVFTTPQVVFQYAHRQGI